MPTVSVQSVVILVLRVLPHTLTHTHPPTHPTHTQTYIITNTVHAISVQRVAWSTEVGVSFDNYATHIHRYLNTYQCNAYRQCLAHPGAQEQAYSPRVIMLLTYIVTDTQLLTNTMHIVSIQNIARSTGAGVSSHSIVTMLLTSVAFRIVTFILVYIKRIKYYR